MPASKLFIASTLLAALVLQVVLYWPTLHQLPFGDDWGPPLSEIVRGERLGPLSFFRETRQPDSYRPMQSLLMWLFGQVEEPARWASVRVLHFLSAGVASVVLGLLLHAWGFGRAGVVAAAVVAAVHPSLVAPVGSIDGFSSILSCAAVWWGVWMMWVTRAKPAVGIALACVALIVGTLVKEYAFAMLPMAALTAWSFYRPRWRWTLVSGGALAALTVLLLWARRFVKPTDMDLPPGDFALEPFSLLATNAVLVLTGGFFFGDSLWLYVERNAIAIAVSATVVLATLYFLAAHFFARPSRPSLHGRDARAKIAFLLFSIIAITFPANVVMRISEMYLCGLVFTVALLAAFAGDAWMSRSAAQRRVAFVLGTLVAASAIVAVRHKVHAMVALGERTKLQTDGLVAQLRDVPEGTSIALLYRRDQVPPRATFSSFRLPDCYLVRPPAVDSLFPGKRLSLRCPPPLPDEASVRGFHPSIADIVLYWDVASTQFQRLK